MVCWCRRKPESLLYILFIKYLAAEVERGLKHFAKGLKRLCGGCVGGLNAYILHPKMKCMQVRI